MLNLDDTKALQSIAASLEKIAGALETLAESRRKKDGEAESLKTIFLNQMKKYGLIDSHE